MRLKINSLYIYYYCFSFTIKVLFIANCDIFAYLGCCLFGMY